MGLFENETDDAYPLEDFIFREVQVESLNHWNTGILTDKFTIQYHHTQYILQNHDKIKIRKTLTISFQAWLESLDDDVFQFIHTLNRINFSIYDILYCYNHLSFQIHEKKQGVNFLVFDNMEKLCSVHHHFDYKTNKNPIALNLH